MPAGTTEHRLAASLGADVVGYSRLMADDEAGAESWPLLRVLVMPSRQAYDRFRETDVTVLLARLLLGAPCALAAPAATRAPG